MSNWTRDQLLVALRLYLTEPFGKLHKTNPRVVALASTIGRTPSSLGMKACNFASLDPTFRRTGRKGLAGASNADRALWRDYESSREALIDKMEELVEPVVHAELSKRPEGPSERPATVKVRRHQRFFRESVLAAYEGRCAVTGLASSELLIASHIVPWSKNESLRADPTNGILLDALFDRAFDAGLVTFDSEHRVVCSKRLHHKKANAGRLLEFSGKQFGLPRRQPPSAGALDWHRVHWFIDSAQSENPRRI